MTPTVAEVIGATLAGQGVEHAFGVLGSGNLIATNALCHGGARFHHARHEGGAVCMADGYARVTGRVGVVSVHQGPGLTNAITGLAEAVKSRTPLLVLTGDTPARALTSNFRIDQHDLVESVGAIADRVHGPDTAPDDAQRAFERAERERRPIVLMAPIDLQAKPATATEPSRPRLAPLARPHPAPEQLQEITDAIAGASRPAIVAGRGAVLAGAGSALQALGDRIGAVLATSAPANGLFAGHPFSLGISGGFSSPLASELLAQADLLLAFGASLNFWTTKHGALVGPSTKIVQVDIEPAALGRHRPVDLAVVGDARITAHNLTDALKPSSGFRTPNLQRAIGSRRWASEPYADESTDDWIDPRTLSIAVNGLLPGDRAVAVDSGHSLGYPSMYLDVPDAGAWVFPNGFQAVGLGLGNAIGAAVARPQRPTVAALGDGGAFMALPELETAVRLKQKLLVLVYDDAAYGAEVHHFRPLGHDVSRAQFPDADLAAIARGAGAAAATVRRTDDLEAVQTWLREPEPRPLLLDAKVNPTTRAEWLEEAFRGG